MKIIKFLSIAIIPLIVVAFGLYVVSSALTAVGLYFVTMITVVVLQKDKSFLKSLVCGWKWKEGMFLSMVSILAGVCLFVLWKYIKKDGANVPEILKKFHLVSWQLFVFAIYLIFINPIIEEIFWRLVLNTNTIADYFIDAIFASYHLLVLHFFLNTFGLILAYIALVVAGIFWRYIKEKYNGLLVPVITHFLADASIIAFLFHVL